jgi:hypothetical protein
MIAVSLADISPRHSAGYFCCEVHELDWKAFQISLGTIFGTLTGSAWEILAKELSKNTV